MKSTAVIGRCFATATTLLLVAASGCGVGEGDCAETAFGREMCGDELVRFCEERYNPRLNSDTCDPVLREAGIDPEEVLAGQRQQERDRRRAARERREQAELDARQNIDLGVPTRDNGIVFTVDAVREGRTIDGAYDEVVESRPGRKFVIAELTYKNAGREPVDLLCSASAGGDGFALIDRAGRTFSVADEAMFSAAENEEACGRETQPGETEDALVVFEVPAAVRPSELLVWNPAAKGPEDGGSHLSLLVAAS